MKKTPPPASQRKHIVIIGKTNAGKSTLFNALLGQSAAIVSPVAGTTTDPVAKPAELIPYGPVVLIDTAGMYDSGILGAERGKKTAAALRRADAAIFTADSSDFDHASYADFAAKKIPHITVFTKCGAAAAENLKNLRSAYPEAVFMYGTDDRLDTVRQKLIALLEGMTDEESPVIRSLLSRGDTAVLVTPIDSEAPKGRLILPQVQILRQCLDCGVKSVVTRPEELADALTEMKTPELVITDSQAFSEVSAIVPSEIPLTSFSMLLACERGDFKLMVDGCGTVDRLKDGARILMLEGCTHNTSHEDIGRHKIPSLLKRRLGKQFTFDFHSGYDFPENLADYDLAVQCGGCMLNRREISARLSLLSDAGVPVTNYGILLAWLSGILERASVIFRKAGLL